MTVRCLDCREGRHPACLGDTLCDCTHVGLDALQDMEFDVVGERLPIVAMVGHAAALVGLAALGAIGVLTVIGMALGVVLVVL